MPEAETTPHRYRFGAFVIDERRGALQKDGEDVPLRPKSWGVLRHLVKHRGELVTKEALLAAVWGDRVVTEGVLAKSVGEIRLALGDDAHDIVRTVPRRGYLFEAPVALETIEDDRQDGARASPDFSQAPAATGVAVLAPGDPPQRAGSAPQRAAAPRVRMARDWRRAAMAAALLAAVIVVLSMTLRDADTIPPEPSIAVLPFINLSDDADNEYFSDGIAEEVLNLLAKIPDVRAISRSSSFSFRGRDIDVPSIAEQLNAAFVLEGSVRRYGDRVRITAQLIETSSDTHLWSETYERELRDVFAIQDDISAAIVESLRETIDLDVDESPTSTAAGSTEAHDAYLRGRYLLAQREVGRAVRELEKAISLDPDYALAHAQLAIAYRLGYLDISFTEAVAKSEFHVERAMALDPSIAEAHAAAGKISLGEGDIQAALRHFEKALQINPSYADVYTWMANTLDQDLGRYAEAFALREKAVRLDPLSIVAMFNYSDHLIKRNRLAEADRELEKLAAMAPSFYALLRGLRLSVGGHWADGALGWLESLRINPDNRRMRSLLAYWFAMLGLAEEALAIIRDDPDPAVLSWLGRPRQAAAAAQAKLAAELAEYPDSPGSHDEVGLALAGVGDYVSARPHLEAFWRGDGGRLVGPNFRIDHAAALIAARQATGEGDDVAELLAAIRDNVRRYREAGISTSFEIGGPDYEDGLAGFLAGDEQRGLALITRAVENGHFIPPRQAYLQDLYEHPDFVAVRALQEARQASERERFLDVVCSDNPYAAVWQPAAGTCERFAAVNAY
jgi:TolB-like protein/DNA-binding winged helix-turn-helix (wHTH) protein/Tfp pilus assembly protein PilF